MNHGSRISPLFYNFLSSVSAWMVSDSMTRNSSATSAATRFWPTSPASREAYLSPQCSHAVPPASWSIWSYLHGEAGMSPCRLPSPATATVTVSIYIILTFPMQHQVLNQETGPGPTASQSHSINHSPLGAWWPLLVFFCAMSSWC